MTIQTPDDLEELRHSHDLVRRYKADGTLYAYRDDGEHVIVSRGREPHTRWTDIIPATVDRPVPGQQRWTIPDNWEARVRAEGRTIYYVPESDVFAKVATPAKCHLVDAWYRVVSVGELTVDTVGTLGESHEVRELADEYEEYDIEQADDDAAAFRAVADQWDAVETDVEMATEWVRDEGIDQLRAAGKPVPADRTGQIEFHSDRIIRPAEALDLSVFEIPTDVVLDDLRDAGLLPDYYRFEIGVDDSAVGMEYVTRGLIEAGATNAAAVDYYMVEIVGMSQTEWAAERGVSQSTVSESVAQAVKALEPAADSF
jgi:hypothetical protein